MDSAGAAGGGGGELAPPASFFCPALYCWLPGGAAAAAGGLSPFALTPPLRGRGGGITDELPPLVGLKDAAVGTIPLRGVVELLAAEWFDGRPSVVARLLYVCVLAARGDRAPVTAFVNPVTRSDMLVFFGLNLMKSSRVGGGAL